MLRLFLPILIVIVFAFIGIFIIFTGYLVQEEIFIPRLETYKTELPIIQKNSLLSYSSIYYPTISSLKIYATVTAFNPTAAQCDSTPNIMASGKHVYLGAIACPRELVFGTQIEIDGKVYTCEDRTAKRYNGRYDILMFDYEEAINFGKQIKEIKFIK